MTLRRVGVTPSNSGDAKYVENWEVSTADGPSLRQVVRFGGSSATLLGEVTPSGHLLSTTAIEQSAPANITVTSGAGLATATGLNDNVTWGDEPPAGSHVTFAPNDDHESAHVQITGTWSGSLTSEASLDGENWFPTNLRRNAAGNEISNVLKRNGLWRGTMAGSRYYRIRALTGFTGTATIVVSGAKLSGTYLLSAVTSIPNVEYLGSSAGGNVIWSVCSQDVNLPTQGLEVPILMVINQDPVGGRVVVMNRYSHGASSQARIRRYETVDLARTGGGARVYPFNQATAQRAAGTESALLCYAGANITFNNDAAGGVTLGTTPYSDQVFIPTGGGQDRAYLDSSVRLPPGEAILWTGIGVSNNVVATITLAYSDGSTLT